MDLYSLLAWLVFGLIVGVVAKFLMPGPDPGGCLITIGLGIAGSLVGGYLAQQVFHVNGTGRFAEYAISIGGAMLLLFAYHMIVGRRGP